MIMANREAAEQFDIVARIREYAREGNTLRSNTERVDCLRVCEVSRAFLGHNALDLIRRHDRGRPLVRFYASDETGTLTYKSWHAKLGARTIRRRSSHGACMEPTSIPRHEPSQL